MRENKGITLIALIITIIVLLILASVSINAVVGDNGVLSQAQNASEKTKAGSEKEAIQFVMSDVNIDELTGQEVEEGKKIGKPLTNRGLGTWEMITVGDQAYGTNWYLLNKGENIPGFKKAKYSWLINYKTGELIQLEENNYSHLSSSDTVIESARNNIIFSLDASSIGQAKSITDLEKEDVDFIGFEDVNENSGLTENSFKFDGVNDYVKIQYDDSPALNQDGTPYMEDGKQLTKKEVFAKNGFTFEFYGILDGGTSQNGTDYRGLFNYGLIYKGEEGKMRFGIIGEGKGLHWNAGYGNFRSDLSADGDTAQWNQYYYIEDAKKPSGEKIIESENLYDGNIHYMALSVDTSKIYETVDGKDYYKHTIYLDGIKAIDAKYNVKSWEYFIENYPDLSYFEVGRAHMSNTSNQCYSKLEAYTLRLYNRALTDEEVEMSYNNSKLLLGES